MSNGVDCAALWIGRIEGEENPAQSFVPIGGSPGIRDSFKWILAGKLPACGDVPIQAMDRVEKASGQEDD